MSGSNIVRKKGLLALLAVAGTLLAFAALYQTSRQQLTTCKRTSQLQMATALETAIYNFHTEYGKLPITENRVKTDTPSGITLLTVLLGLEKSGEHQNTRDIKFLSVREGKNRKNGLIYSESGDSIKGLFDPWGNPYTVVLDTDLDEILRFKLGGKDIELKNRRVAAFSPGPDHQEGTSDDVRTGGLH
jgi:hypothetical protein